jgi:hypothetical protein
MLYAFPCIYEEKAMLRLCKIINIMADEKSPDREDIKRKELLIFLLTALHPIRTLLVSHWNRGYKSLHYGAASQILARGLTVNGMLVQWWSVGSHVSCIAWMIKVNM